jgi:hypothetical protein
VKPDATRRFVIVGLGGIGGLVLRLLVPFLHHERGDTIVVCADGDSFEPRNRARMWFEDLGPKANVLAEELARDYGDRVTLIPVPHYVTPRRATSLIQERDVVFCTPDNHATRRLVERRCSRLGDVALFSGGNDGVEENSTGTFGNVQVYLREGGRDTTNPLSTFHPEILNPGSSSSRTLPSPRPWSAPSTPGARGRSPTRRRTSTCSAADTFRCSASSRRDGAGRHDRSRSRARASGDEPLPVSLDPRLRFGSGS